MISGYMQAYMFAWILKLSPTHYFYIIWYLFIYHMIVYDSFFYDIIMIFIFTPS